MNRSDCSLRFIFLAVVGFALAACDGSINQAVHVASGTKDAAAGQTINGAIVVGDDATVTSGSFRTVNGSAVIGARSVVPSVSTVNGSIRVGDDTQTGELKTVNGGVTLGERARVSADVMSVNGAVTLQDGTVVSGKVVTVNGHINLNSAHVAGSVENVSGGMQILGASVIKGDLMVHEASGMSVAPDRPVIVIGPEVKVEGRLIFERDVDLRIHRGAEVGEISGATPTWIEPTPVAGDDEG